MSKRFTDTDKWKRPWFSDLEFKAKLVWFYVLDNCDHRGVWYADFKLLSFQVGFKITREQFEDWFCDKVRPFADKFFIPSFVEFQYGELNPGNNAHKSVIKLLEELSTFESTKESETGQKEGAEEGLGSPPPGAQDKEEDKDKDKDNFERGVGKTFKVIAEFYGHPDISEFVINYKITMENQKGWLKLYDIDYIKREIIKAVGWISANKAKASKPGPGANRFMSGWLDRGWESYRKSLPSNKPGDTSWMDEIRAQEAAKSQLAVI